MITALLQANRLEKFAKRLMSNDIKPKIKMINTKCRLFVVDEKYVGELPLLYGPLQLLPRIFKDDWVLTENGNVFWIEDRSQHPINSLQLFFGMNLLMVSHCFIANSQNIKLFGGGILSTTCTSKEIGRNLLHLIQSQIVAQDLLTTINAMFSKN
ncbi:MAG: hypothetical protein ABI763_01040 [Bacteroidota bacterium]